MTTRSRHSSDKPDPESHSSSKPEFIVIEDTKEYVYGSSSLDRPEEEILKQKIKNPISIRMLCFLALMATFIFIGALFSYLILILLIAMICFFQNEGFNRSLRRLWKVFKNSWVIAVGLALGIFSPALGFTVLLVYFSLKGSGKDRDLLRRTLKRFTSEF